MSCVYMAVHVNFSLRVWRTLCVFCGICPSNCTVRFPHQYKHDWRVPPGLLVLQRVNLSAVSPLRARRPKTWEAFLTSFRCPTFLPKLKVLHCILGSVVPTTFFCFQRQNQDLTTFAEVSKFPKGMEWLWHPQIVELYNQVLQGCEINSTTREAAAGALQNITAGDKRVRCSFLLLKYTRNSLATIYNSVLSWNCLLKRK